MLEEHGCAGTVRDWPCTPLVPWSGELALPLTGCSTQGSRPCWQGVQVRGPKDLSMGELNLALICHAVGPSLAAAFGRAGPYLAWNSSAVLALVEWV